MTQTASAGRRSLGGASPSVPRASIQSEFGSWSMSAPPFPALRGPGCNKADFVPLRSRSKFLIRKSCSAILHGHAGRFTSKARWGPVDPHARYYGVTGLVRAGSKGPAEFFNAGPVTSGVFGSSHSATFRSPQCQQVRNRDTPRYPEIQPTARRALPVAP